MDCGRYRWQRNVRPDRRESSLGTSEFDLPVGRPLACIEAIFSVWRSPSTKSFYFGMYRNHDEDGTKGEKLDDQERRPHQRILVYVQTSSKRSGLMHTFNAQLEHIAVDCQHIAGRKSNPIAGMSVWIDNTRLVTVQVQHLPTCLK